MSESSRWWLLLPRPVRELPADLAAVLGLVLVTLCVVLLPGVRETPLRVVFGLPFVLFLPGYAVIAALFPEDGGKEDGEREGIDGIERVALSFGLSIAVVPLVGLVLNFTPFGIRLLPILLSVSGLTVALVVVGAVRRRELPPEERFRVPYRDWIREARGELFEPESQLDAALNVLLVVSVLVAVASVGYAVAVPKQGESFTEFYLLTQQENGSLVADDYPTEFTRGEARPLVVGISNHEHGTESYTGVVELQRVQIRNNSTQVLEERELRRFSTRLGANETYQSVLNVTPTMTGERLRLAFLLYKGGVPAEPSVESAYRELHLWVNVSAPQKRIYQPRILSN